MYEDDKKENPLGTLAILLVLRKNSDNTQRQGCLAVLGRKTAVSNPKIFLEAS